MPLLEVRGLVKYYGRRKVVDGVSFEVNAGEVVGLLGPNGAGKTTSFRMATGQITPNDGTVLFNGEDVTRLPMYRRARLGIPVVLRALARIRGGDPPRGARCEIQRPRYGIELSRPRREGHRIQDCSNRAAPRRSRPCDSRHADSQGSCYR